MVEVSCFHKISHPAIKGYLNFRKPPARCGPAWERKSPSTGADEPQKKPIKNDGGESAEKIGNPRKSRYLLGKIWVNPLISGI